MSGVAFAGIPNPWSELSSAVRCAGMAGRAVGIGAGVMTPVGGSRRWRSSLRVGETAEVSKVEAVSHSLGVLGVTNVMEVQMRCKLPHQVVVRRVGRMHCAQTTGSCRINQMLHQRSTQTLALPLVSNRDCKFAILAAGLCAEPCHSEFFLGQARTNTCQECNVSSGFEDRQLLQEFGARRAHRLQKSEAPRGWRKRLDEATFQCDIFHLECTNGDCGAIQEEHPPRGGPLSFHNRI